MLKEYTVGLLILAFIGAFYMKYRVDKKSGKAARKSKLKLVRKEMKNLTKQIKRSK